MSQKGQSSTEFERGAERFLRWLGPLRPSVKTLKRISLVFPILHALVCVWFIVVSLLDRQSWPVWIAPLLAVNGIAGLITGLAHSSERVTPLVLLTSVLTFGTTWLSLKALMGLARLGNEETILTLSGGLVFLSYQFFHHARLENLALDPRSSSSGEVKNP